VLTSTETAGAIAAIAQAEVTGGIGACLTTLGPGAASVVNGVACAFLERAPLLIFTDTQPMPFEHQRLDHRALMSSITKQSHTMTADRSLQIIVRAIGEARSGRPGPVHIDFPAGVADAFPQMGDDWNDSFGVEMSSKHEGSRFEALVARSRKPLLLVGLGARRAADADAVRRLCERRGVPAMVTYKAKGVVPDGHEWFAGVFTNTMIEQAAIDACDLLVGVGLDPIEPMPRPWKQMQPIVLCNPWRVEDAHLPFAAQFVAPMSEGVRLLEETLSTSQWDPAMIHALIEDQRRRVRIPATGLTAQGVVELVSARLANVAARVTVDAGAHMIPATTLWPVREPNEMLISNGLSTMGFALPAAIGASLLDKSRPVVALTGDGGLLMCAGELLTAAREGLPVTTIVFNDASLSLIEIKQQARALPAAGVALGDVDWAKMAESVGVAAWSAADEPSLERAIAAAQARGGPALIDARIDRSNYGATLRAVRG